MNANELREQKAKLISQAQAISAGAKAAGRDLTKDEEKKIDALLEEASAHEFKAVAIEDAEQRAAKLAAAVAGLDTPAPTAAPAPVACVVPPVVITGGTPRNDLADTTHGFRNLGEFARHVRAAELGGVMDERLMIGAAQGANEAIGEEGGFLIPAEFSSKIASHSLEDDSLLALTEQDPVSGNNMTYPADQTVAWGTDGVQATWEGEGAILPKTKLKLEARTLRLKKLTCLVPITDELIADAPTLSSYLFGLIGRAIRWKTNEAIVEGTGPGRPTGFAGHDAEVTQAKEGSQTAVTVVAANVAKMYSRLSSFIRPMWLMNNDVFPQIITMTVGTAPIWTPPSTGLVGAPKGFLLGIPIMFNQSCETLGTKGDIRLVDFAQYRTITKQGGVQFDTSIHLWFDRGETAFRAIFRMDGKPWMSAPITPNKGSNTLSPFVTLATRS